MSLWVLVAIVVIVVAFMLFSVKPWQGKKWIITTAKPSELHVTRTFSDGFNDTRDAMAFHLDYKILFNQDSEGKVTEKTVQGYGKKIRVGRHWMLEMEEE